MDTSLKSSHSTCIHIYCSFTTLSNPTPDENERTRVKPYIRRNGKVYNKFHATMDFFKTNEEIYILYSIGMESILGFNVEVKHATKIK